MYSVRFAKLKVNLWNNIVEIQFLLLLTCSLHQNQETTNVYEQQDRPVLVALVSGGSEMQTVADKLIAVGYDLVVHVEPPCGLCGIPAALPHKHWTI